MIVLPLEPPLLYPLVIEKDVAARSSRAGSHNGPLRGLGK
jgi:hypothetical protein